MPQYFFILGRNPALSRAEIVTALAVETAFEVITDHDNFLIVETDERIDAESFQRKLGGTIKTGVIIGQLANLEAEELFYLFESYSASVEHPLSSIDYKVNFGLSPYNLKFDVSKFGQELKKLFKEHELKSRFVSSQTYPLGSVIVTTNKLLTTGIEFCLFKTEDGLAVGRTIAVQQYEEFSEFDYGRPARDARSGMLPPKLARMMINLSGLGPRDYLLDPFCGSGTVLQEAILLGHDRIIGSDLSTKAIKDSATNLKWLGEKLGREPHPELYETDATKISAKLGDKKIKFVVTEPDLGPPLRGHETADMIQYNVKVLTDLYRRAFLDWDKFLPSGGTVVIVIPEFKTKSGNYRLDLKAILPAKFKLDGSWEYSRPDQRVVRKICRVVKQ